MTIRFAPPRQPYALLLLAVAAYFAGCDNGEQATTGGTPAPEPVQQAVPAPAPQPAGEPAVSVTPPTGRPDDYAPLPTDTVGQVAALPDQYPKDWVIAADATFFHMFDAKFILLDPTADTAPRQIKGMLSGSFIPLIAQSPSRNEFYVTDLFYSRGWRGERTDVISIYDQATLALKDEIVIPGAKRATTIPQKFALQLIDNERLLLVFNMTPATSVTVIDVATRTVLGDISLPGCALTYPTGRRGFSSLCGDGSLVSYQLDADGQVAAQTRLEPFNDIANDALFEEATIINGVGYFPTFSGHIREIDLRADSAVIGPQWPLVPDAETAANWRPGGLQLTGADPDGHLYILMHPNGAEGTHKDAGSEVWIYDVANRARIQRVVLQNQGIVIEVTQSDQPRLLVVNPDMNIDVYDAAGGNYLRTLQNLGQETILVMHAIQ